MENIRKRLIKPLRKGVVYVNPMKQMLNYELMTDNEILLCVKKGYLPDNAFDWTEYNNAQKPIAEKTPVAAPTAEEIPVTESPAEVETPAMEPTAAETPVVKTPKRNTKRGQK